MRQRVIAALIVAFVAGAVAGPVLPLWSEHRTVVVTSAGQEPALRSLTANGWTVQRTDRLDGIGYLVTLERPRVSALLYR